MPSEQAKTRRATSKGELPPTLLPAMTTRLRENKRVRRTLPDWGRVHVDRQVPFLCAYRNSPQFEHLGMHQLVTSEAAYLCAPSAKRLQSGIQEMVSRIAEVMSEQFGAFLLLEIWPAYFDDDGDGVPDWGLARPRFRIVTQPEQDLGSFVDKFNESLSRIKIEGQGALVDVVSRKRIAPPGLAPLLSAEEAKKRNCVVLGLGVAPIFANGETGEIFPLVRRQLERSLTLALKRIFFEFARSHTTQRPPHYHALGRRATVKAVWRADQLLADVADAFDFLLQISPINGFAAWREFQKGKYKKKPTFHYRPLPIDPILLKRELFETPIERVEDPAIGRLLRDKLVELDRQLTMLQDINTPPFVHGSIQLYGSVEESLLSKAEAILLRFPKGSKTKPADCLDAEAFATRARREIAYLKERDERVKARVEVRDDVNGLIVSHGSLLVGSATSVPLDRVEALIQHEIGTHVLTYYNGRAQPFRQLSSGLSGYEALQEGIAVLSEYLVGGLNESRLRLLAARVVAVRMLTDGNSFLQCFERMVDQYHFIPRAAFTLTMRVFRGGGLTKDAIYLRGLLQTLEYLGKGGELEPLFIGKISAEHISMMKELRWRRVLEEPPLQPRYLADPASFQRLERVREGIDVLDLVESRKRAKSRPGS